VNPNSDHFRNRLAASRTSFSDVWETVKPEVLPIVQLPQKKLIDNVLQIIEMAASGERSSVDEVGFKNLWNFNLPDANFGTLILEIKDGQVASEQRSEGNSSTWSVLMTGFNFDYRRAERRVKPVASQPVEQNVAQVALPTIPSHEKVVPPTPAKEVSMPLSVDESPTPVTADEPPPETFTAEKSTASPAKQWGKPTAQIWIGDPPDDVHSLFSSPHREKIRDTRTTISRGTNYKYALVYFHNVEDATAAIESLTHSKIKYGEEYSSQDGRGRGGNFPRGGGSFSQSSFDSRKSGASDIEVRGGFGRGGRGGRGGSSRGSTGTFSSRGSGSGSPAPARGGSMRARGGAFSSSSSHQKEVAGDKQEWSDKPETPEAGWPNEEKPPVPATAVSTSDTGDAKSTNPAPAVTQPPPPASTSTTAPAATSTGGQSSTIGDSHSS
jgi:Protein of unknown function (DUF2433)